MSSVSIAAVKRRGNVHAFALLELVGLLVGVGVLCLHVLPRAWQVLNTDFPNDYVAARLVREGYTVDRIYEWEWFEEQKSRMGITQPMAGFIPHTPFSVVPMLPFTWFEPLSAKRAWVLLTLGLLAGSIALIANLANLHWRWIAAAAFLSLPLYRNLEYGQYYVLLLFLLSAALWCDRRRHPYASGVFISFAAGLKIFPIVLVLFYIRKRDYRAVGGVIIGLAVVVGLSLASFGETACIRFLNEVFPAALHGEAMDPFALPASSIPALLHHLFILDPLRNRYPAANLPRLAGTLVPLLQMLILAPAVLACSRSRDEKADPLQWSCLLVATLTISTLPASYNFILLLLPCALLVSFLLAQSRCAESGLCASLYFLVGWAESPVPNPSGVWAIASVPRLWLLLLLVLLFLLVTMAPQLIRISREWVWVAALGVLCGFQMVSLARHENQLYDSHLFLATAGIDMFVVASPARQEDGIVFHGMSSNGWTWAELDRSNHIFLHDPPYHPSGWLVEHEGRHSLWSRDPDSRNSARVSSPGLDVYDFSSPDSTTFFFSASGRDHLLQLYEAKSGDKSRPLNISNARYPVVSPDGRWLAYSSLRNGFWRLTVRDLAHHENRFIDDAQCNDASPVWAADSRSLIYLSDCGRGLWQMAFAGFTLFR